MPTTQRVAYVRVSSAGQNLDRQLEAVGEVDRTYSEYQSVTSFIKQAGFFRRCMAGQVTPITRVLWAASMTSLVMVSSSLILSTRWI